MLDKIIKQASDTLKRHSISTHELDSQLILSNIMNTRRENLITNTKLTISAKNTAKYKNAIKQTTSDKNKQ